MINILRVFSLGLTIALIFSSMLAYAESPKVMTPVEFVEMSRLSDPRLSPNGRYILYLRSETNWEENDSFNRYVLKVVETGEVIPVFPAKDETEDMSVPIWLPDSSGFITLLRREKVQGAGFETNKKRQAFHYDLKTRQLVPLTNSSTSVGNVKVRSDGAGFYYTAEKPRGDFEDKLLKKDFAIQAYETEQPDQLWFYDFSKKSAKTIFDGLQYLQGYNLSRDAKKVIYRLAPGPNRDDRHDGEIWLFDLATKQAVQLTENAYAELDFKLSPDSKHFSYIATVNVKGEPYYEDNLFVQTIGDAEPELILPEESMEMLDFYWGRSSEELFILGNTGLRTQIYRYDLSEKKLFQITKGDHQIFDWDYKGTTHSHSYLLRNEKTPGDVYVFSAEDSSEKISTEYNDWADKFILPKQEPFQWKRGRTSLEGLLVYPVDYVEGQRFPLITITHGGPRSSSQFGAWNTSRSVAVFAGQGYGVFLPNHRGGTGYGDDFMRDMVGGYFNNAHLDVMSGIDALVEAGLADPDKLIKHGWSAGGHMTNKLITVTGRFKAASSGAGVSDWISMYGESDIRHNRTPWFGGAPWQKNAPLKTYKKNSPLKDAWKITTPTLFWNGNDDVRVPPTQGIMMYRGAKAAGVETKLYLAPDQPHGFKAPGYKLFKINTELAWYAEHLGREIPPPDLPEIFSEAFITTDEP